MIASPYLTLAAFAVICLVLLTLPFIPAFQEWRHPTDVAALPVSANYTNDIDHFARRLHADVAARMGEGPATGYEDFEFVSDGMTATEWGNSRKRLIARQSIASTPAIRCAQPLYVMGSIQAGEGSSFPALYATGDIELGAHSDIGDWAHAEGVVRLGSDSVGLRRISADVAVELAAEVWFERLHAPALYFGHGGREARPLDAHEQMPGSYADLPGAIRQTPLLYLVRGNCVLPPGLHYQGSLVVTGFLSIGAGTTVTGDIKARKGLSIDQRAAVQGAVTCEKRIYVFADARVWGPVISESDVMIAGHAVIGQPQALTTVSAANIIVEDGATVHGTVWAHEIGMVRPS